MGCNVRWRGLRRALQGGCKCTIARARRQLLANVSLDGAPWRWSPQAVLLRLRHLKRPSPAPNSRWPSTARWLGTRATRGASRRCCRATATVARKPSAWTQRHAEVVARRKRGLRGLGGARIQQRFPESLAATAEAVQGLSDLQFTGAYRRAIPVSRAWWSRASKWVRLCSPVRGVTVTDLDGNIPDDLTGLVRRQPVWLRLLQRLH